MKTSILTFAIALSALIGVSNTTRAAAEGKDAVTILTQASPVSKIEVRGNVELYVSDGPTDQVKVYNQYYSENAVVQGQDGLLRIASYGDQKLVIWVTSSNLQKVSLYDNASVKSFGKLSVIDLDVNLYNNASARLNVDAIIVDVKLHGHAKADLSGSASNATLNCDYSSTLNYAMLDSEHLEKTVNFEQKQEINNLVAIQ
ncbi:MAG: GIN domain-containing protein [Mucilaginibacter sp.]